MRISKVSISNIYGIKNKVLEPKDITIFEGANGKGKTSILDSITLALTNKGVRPRIIKNDAEEGEIQLETNSGLNIHRKKRTEKSDYNRISNNGVNITSPEAYLKELFNTSQMNPIEFIEKTPREQCKILLSMLEIEFTTNDYQKYFGMIPPDFDEEKHVLEMLDYLQSNKSKWWIKREKENRQELFKRQAVIDDLEKLPADYDVKFWDQYELSTITDKINLANKTNQDIENCQNYINSEPEKKAKIDIDINSDIEHGTKKYNDLKIFQDSIINNCDNEIKRLEDEILKMKECKKDAKKEIDKIQSNIDLYKESLELKRNQEKREIEIKVIKSKEFIENTEKPSDDFIENLKKEYKYSEEMKKHVSFYNSIMERKREQQEHFEEAKRYGDLINIARSLPIELMKNAKSPIEGLTVLNGDVLKDGKPIGNLSEGEQLLLAFDVAMNQVGELKIVLADGFEKLSKNNRDLFIEKAKLSGLQFFITRVTDNEEMTIVEI